MIRRNHPAHHHLSGNCPTYGALHWHHLQLLIPINFLDDRRAVQSSWQDIILCNWCSFPKVQQLCDQGQTADVSATTLVSEDGLGSFSHTASLVRDTSEKSIHPSCWGLWLSYSAIMKGVPGRRLLWAAGPCGWESPLRRPASHTLFLSCCCLFSIPQYEASQSKKNNTPSPLVRNVTRIGSIMVRWKA